MTPLKEKKKLQNSNNKIYKNSLFKESIKIKRVFNPLPLLQPVTS